MNKKVTVYIDKWNDFAFMKIVRNNRDKWYMLTRKSRYTRLLKVKDITITYKRLEK